MYSKFQNVIIEELEETGDIPIVLLVPWFLEHEKNKKILTQIDGIAVGIGEIAENYEITDQEFIEFKAQLIAIWKELNLALFKFIGSIKSEIWDEHLVLLNDEETQRYFSDKLLWNGSLIQDKKEFAIFIGMRER